MLKHTQIIHRQFANELFEFIWPFCGVSVERVKKIGVRIMMILVKYLTL